MKLLVVVLCLLSMVKAGGASPVAEGQPLLHEQEYLPLRSAWHEVRAALNREDWAEAQARLPQLRKVKLDLGLPNLFEVSFVLVRAAHRASETGSQDAALRFAEVAQNLSPKMAHAHFERATQTLEEDAFELPEALRHLRSGYDLLADDPIAKSIFVANGLSGLILLGLLLLAFFCITLVTRYSSSLLRDFQRLLGHSIDRLQGAVLLLGMVLTPLFFGFGLVATFVSVLIIHSLYATRLERGVIVVLLLASGGLVHASQLVERSLSFENSPEHAIYRCNMGACSQRDRDVMRRLLEDPDYRYAAAYTTALVHARHTQPTLEQLDEARRYLEMAWKVDDSWRVRIVHGNVAYAQALTHCSGVLKGEPVSTERYVQGIEEAKGYWELAVEKNAESVEGHYNLSVVGQLLNNPGFESKHMKESVALDAERVGNFQDAVSEGRTEERCSYWTQPNRHVMSPSGPWESASGGFFDVRGESSMLAAPLSELLSGTQGANHVTWIAWLGAPLVFLLLIMGRFTSLSCPCRQCTSVASPETRVTIAAGAVCEECVLADMGRGVLDAKSQWNREQRVNNRKARRIRNQRLITWVLPGFAAVLRGRPVRGLLVFGLFAASILWATDVHVVLEAVHSSTGPSLGRSIPLALMAATLYLVSLVRVHRKRGLHE